MNKEPIPAGPPFVVNVTAQPFSDNTIRFTVNAHVIHPPTAEGASANVQEMPISQAIALLCDFLKAHHVELQLQAEPRTLLRAAEC